MSMTTLPYSKTNPFLATVKDRYSLSKPGSGKNTQHVVLGIHHSGFRYQVGDSVGVFPENDPLLIEQTLKAIKAKGDEIIRDKNSGEPWPLRLFLQKKANLTTVSRKLLSEIKERQTNPAKKEKLAQLFEEENKEHLKSYLASHEVWDLYAENEEVSFSLEEVSQLLMPMLPRLYSIASSMEAVGDEVHLTVSLLNYYTNGHLRFGVCTHYLCNLAPMHEPKVPIYIQPNHGFTLPQDNDQALIMIGPGTGIAPYRGFMQERMCKGSKAKHWLFFGEWNRTYDYYYEDYWEELRRKNLLKVSLAFSRDQDYKIYVQHCMLEHAAELFKWIQEGAVIYVCGDAHHMAKDVDACLHQIVQEQGLLSELEAKDFIKKLKADKRYLRDVY